MHSKRTTKKGNRNKDHYHRYKLEWGNYQTDKYKTKKILRQEIGDLLRCIDLPKADLIEIKELIHERVVEKVYP